MQIVIDIPEDEYQNILHTGKASFRTVNAIEAGTPLPNGKLIILSEDAVKREQTPLRFSCQNWISEIGLSNATVAIIEADKESED